MNIDLQSKYSLVEPDVLVCTNNGLPIGGFGSFPLSICAIAFSRDQSSIVDDLVCKLHSMVVHHFVSDLRYHIHQNLSQYLAVYVEEN